MIKFLLKGVWRDSSRSKFPIIIVSIGVFFTIFMIAFLGGVFRDMIDINARFSTGHVKVTTLGYAENQAQNPLDLALLDLDSLTTRLEAEYPNMEWAPRIYFGGLIDIPGEDGETENQGPASGQAIDLLSENSGELERLNIPNSIRSGRLPDKPGEALLSEKFAATTGLQPGDEVTFFGSTMYGSMTFQNFIISGTISFGNPTLDKGGIIIDLSDARQMLDMQNGSTEVLGYFPDGIYDDERAQNIASDFNQAYTDSTDEFSATMAALKQQNDLGSYIDYANNIQQIFVVVFVIAMSIVLWNVGLLGGLRRYKEFGVRLALGESKHAIFKNMLVEAAAIGVIGSMVGTLLGMAVVFPMQKYGIDISGLIPQSDMMIPSIYRAIITPSLFYIGFIPGVGAMLLGQALAGAGIYKRETANLFKELEV